VALQAQVGAGTGAVCGSKNNKLIILYIMRVSKSYLRFRHYLLQLSFL
jgi:hypothetical protein